jgi:hypothetical protein
MSFQPSSFTSYTNAKKLSEKLISVGRSDPKNLSDIEAFITFQTKFSENFFHPAIATFNVDESRVSLNDAKKAGRRFTSATYRKTGTKGRRDGLYSSVVPFVSAAGEVISVFYVLASPPGQPDLLVPHHRRARDHTGYREYYLTTATGYTNDEIFPAMVAQFEEDFHRLYPGLRVVCYMDRLSSHCTAGLLASLQDKQVSLVLFPSGTTQFFQPLDDVVFALFKNKLRAYRDEELTSEPLRTDLQEHTLLSAMMRALKEALEPGPIKASFANTGIYPWNPDRIRENAQQAFPDPKSVDCTLPAPPRR